MLEVLEKEKLIQDQGFRVFNNLSFELENLWNELYKQNDSNRAYNCSFDFCKIWFSQFSQGKKPYIITFWQNKELVLLAPFYIKNNRLALIGTKPDMYDEFNILYKSSDLIEKLSAKLIDYIFDNSLEINFKHMNSSSIFAKKLINKIAGSGISKTSEASETKPILTGSFSTENKLRSDIKRCKKNLSQTIEAEYLFELSTSKSEDTVEEFLQFHKNRWNGGMFEKKQGLEDFFRNLVKKENSLIISKLFISSNQETAAYAIGYIDSSNKYWLSMVSYNTKYKKYAPGKVLLYELISELFKKGIYEFDFGRGSEPYKKDFANNEDILINVQTYKNNRIYLKARNLTDKILKLVFRVR